MECENPVINLKSPNSNTVKANSSRGYISAVINNTQNVEFKIDVCEDMTINWTEFTRNRYFSFLERKNDFIDLHGSELFDQMEYFYMKIVEYFNMKAIGGLRLICSK